MRTKVGPRDIVGGHLVYDDRSDKMALIINLELSPGRPSQLFVEAPESILRDIAELANKEIEELAKRPPMKRIKRN